MKLSEPNSTDFEKRIAEQDSDLVFLFKNMINAFVLFRSVFDDDGRFISYRFVYINDAYEKITGVRNSDVKGKTVHEVWQDTEPEWIERYGKVATTGISDTFELYHKPTDKLYHCNVYRPFDNNERFCVIFEDITERKKTERTLIEQNHEYAKLNEKYLTTIDELQKAKEQAEEIQKQFMALFEQSPLSIQIFNCNGLAINANQAWSDLWQSPRDKMLNKYNVLEDECLKEKGLLDSMRKAFEGEVVLLSDIEYDPQQNGSVGRKRILEIIAFPIVVNKKVENVVIIHSDITVIKEYEIELIKAKEQAEESDRLKSAFLQNMTHEVRTPLNAISGFSQLLTRGNHSPEKITKFSDTINSNSQKLIDIVSNVIEISQIQAKLISVRNSNFNVIQTLADTVNEYKPILDTKGIQFIVNKTITGNEYYILSDKIKIAAIFKCLVDNALKFTEKGQITIDLKLQSDKIEFVVTDTGIGVSKEMQQKIFEPFRQVEAGLSRNYGGNGLGLAIVKAYTKMLNGTINLQSQSNIGTSISITIPATQILQQDASNRYFQKQSYALNTILIVEDERDNYEYLAELLSETKATILYASNGQKAVDLCRNEAQIDFVFMDIKMPVMDGHTATKRIKMFRPDLPIVAQTAYALDSDKEIFLESGFDDYICKPILAETLFATIDKYINR